MLESKSPFRGQGHYDYIIAGAGCAGLSLAVHMIQSGKFSDKKILIVDKEEKKKNDRTWCFWETEPGLFEPLVYQKWKQVWFHGEKFSKLLSLQPYEYKLVRGIDFYNYCFDLIKKQSNIDILFGEVKEMNSDEKKTWLAVDGDIYSAHYIFNSLLFQRPLLKKKEYYLLQHFKGWLIETEKPVFNPGEATLMDFRSSQQHGTTFVYVMPFSETKALVEYTLFSEKVLEPSQYEKGLKEYIAETLRVGSYKITETEFGIIPMTNHKFSANENNIIHIGSAGGQTKASSGYTFGFIQKHSACIVQKLVSGKQPICNNIKSRFRFYDSTFLYILQNKKLAGEKIFSALFKKNKPQQVLRFLDNESSLSDELKIISSLPTWPFLKAALKQL
ncbi:MAG TPA: lycopene cyclase family protein [Chitinophagaceae bacterium]|nr:lycopene cyclase family protein [Chitinophagaceae bacterium]